MDSVNDTSRFLMQATLGANQQLIDSVAETGIETWLQQQLNQPVARSDTFESSTRDIWQYFRGELVKTYGEAAINGDGNDPALPYKWYFHMAWWHHTLTSNEDLLRQRVAQALSEILVISDNSSLELDSVAMANYYDLLYNHAFGNYNDLLYAVSMHPCMGVYLSHMNNEKADPARHIHPDENYAREIMQLFSIGLYELNPDGSRKQNINGEDIPTYDNTDIKALARVFTGLRAQTYQYEWTTSFWDASNNGFAVSFDDGVDKTYKRIPFVNMIQPMVVDENYHDREPKQLLNGWINLAGGQSGAEEVQTVVNRLVAHPSTAPFIAKHLINQLVTSNPSPAYVQAVAEKFGTTGNLKATVEEILTYPLRNTVASVKFASATSSNGKTIQSQKLKSPLLRVTQTLRAFNASNQSGFMWMIGDDVQDSLSQHPFSSPTVFNFYKPDFVPHGLLEKAKLVAPEFELHTSATSIAWVNVMYYWFFGDYYPAVSTVISSEPNVFNVPELDPDKLQNNTQDKIQPDFSRELELAADPTKHDQLIDDMSLLLTGKTNLKIKDFIKDAFKDYNDNPLWVVQTIAFMLTISPEFTVLEA
ncbi:DUF1800 family protein [Candidatus Albibeggiatoa sp. nov. NOAA]|uniref:DUF1800 domain-containing protein n=1 Tax=Candidatus Albibeggiatoa sp. nov. NOAA TaxID=3162724 RepID=UPI003301E37F|nr:DUF1800 domain-containing protein [Thiotrichaceae bacterium]